jgi:hypothetical protein
MSAAEIADAVDRAEKRDFSAAIASYDTIRTTASRLTCRRLSSIEDIEAVGRLRQLAFDRKEIYREKFGASVVEEIDFLPDTYLFGLFEGARLVSSVRLNRLSRDFPHTPAMSLFADFLNPLLDQGATFIDASRFAQDSEAAEDLPGLPLLTLRLGPIATIALNTDYGLAAIKKEHSAFYRRVFRMSQMAGPIANEKLLTQSVLVAGARSGWADLVQRYPVFQYLDSERRLLFERTEHGAPYLSVVPTPGIMLQEAS